MSRSFLNWLWIGGLSFLVLPFAFFLSSSVVARPEYLILFSFPHFILSYVIYYKHIRSLRSLTPELIRVAVLMGALAVTFVFWHAVELPVILGAQALLLYHLGMQSFGVTMVYSPKFMREDKTTRWLLRANFVSWGATAWLEQQTTLSSLTLFKTSVSSLHLSPEFSLFFTRLSLILTATSILFWIAKLHEQRKFDVRQDIFAVTGIISFAAWCLPQTRIATTGLIAIFHGIQYLPFVVSSLKTKVQSRLVIFGTLGFSVLMGVLVFDQVPRILSEADPVRSTFMISCLYLTLNLLHFFLETKVWKSFGKSEPANVSMKIAA